MTLFQSTHPSGVRLAGTMATQAPSLISIHAPQWGATDDTVYDLTTIQFQSTHPSGVRHGTRYNTVYSLLFQSTHPSGVRLA